MKRKKHLFVFSQPLRFFDKTLLLICVALLVITIIFELNLFGAFLIALCIVSVMKKSRFPASNKLAPINEEKHRSHHRIVVIILTILLLISVLGSAWNKNPSDVWPISNKLILLLFISLLLEYIFLFKLSKFRGILVLILAINVYSFLSTNKALWPNKYDKLFVLDSRFYNYISSTGAVSEDWKEDWYRFNATKSEIEELVNELDKSEYGHGARVVLLDSIKRIPVNSMIGHGISPFTNIEEPSLHWYSEDQNQHYALNLYYHELSQTAILVRLIDGY